MWQLGVNERAWERGAWCAGSMGEEKSSGEIVGEGMYRVRGHRERDALSKGSTVQEGGQGKGCMEEHRKGQTKQEARGVEGGKGEGGTQCGGNIGERNTSKGMHRAGGSGAWRERGAGKGHGGNRHKVQRKHGERNTMNRASVGKRCTEGWGSCWAPALAPAWARGWNWSCCCCLVQRQSRVRGRTADTRGGQAARSRHWEQMARVAGGKGQGAWNKLYAPLSLLSLPLLSLWQY